jgi:hypothetical protein
MAKRIEVSFQGWLRAGGAGLSRRAVYVLHDTLHRGAIYHITELAGCCVWPSAEQYFLRFRFSALRAEKRKQK